MVSGKSLLYWNLGTNQWVKNICNVFIGTGSWESGVGWVQLKGVLPWRHLLLSLNSRQVLKFQKSSALLTNLASCSSTWYHSHESRLPGQLLCTVTIRGQSHMYEALASQLSWPYCLLSQESMTEFRVITSYFKSRHGDWLLEVQTWFLVAQVVTMLCRPIPWDCEKPYC